MADNILQTITKITYGTDSSLSAESKTLKDLTARVTENSIKKFNSQVPNNDLFGYAQHVGLSSFFKGIATTNNELDHNKYKSINNNFAEKMVETGSAAALTFQAGNNESILAYDNYETMAKLITECAMGLDTYVANIVSPDDFTKRIFSVKYNDESKRQKLEPIVKECIKKYNLEIKCSEIIREALKLGTKYLAVLQYTDEFNKMLNDTTKVMALNEALDNVNSIDEGFAMHQHTTVPNEYNFNFTKDEKQILESFLDVTYSKNSNLSESINDMNENKMIISKLCDILNENVKIGSSYDSLKKRFELETTMGDLARGRGKTKPTGKLGSNNTEENTLRINGSAIRYLETSKVVKIEVDNICYGYYYIEYEEGTIGKYNGQMPMSMYQNMPGSPIVKSDVSSNDPSNATKPQSKILKISDEMYEFISGVFLQGIANKLDKQFLSDNKQLKDIIYSLVRQKYIKDKPIKITYFKPEEVIEFNTGSIFENSVYIAKLYLATLTNDIIIKLGRGHDKRIFYINTGIAKDYEAAIQKTVQDIKSKDIGFNSLGSINSALSLSSGRFDDYYVPVLPDGTKAVQIDAIAGANTNEDTELLEYFRKELINSMKLPAAYISDMSENVEFARNVSAQNAEFLRVIIGYQLILNKSFTELIRTLVRNETIYSKDGILDEGLYDVSAITVEFPSPGALQMTNLLEQTTNASSVADFILMMYGHINNPDDAELNDIFKGKVMRYLLGDILDWDKFRSLYKESKQELSQDRLIDKAKASGTERIVDPNAGYGGAY